MRQAIELSKKAMDEGAGPPFGAVIVRDGKVIAEDHNNSFITKDLTWIIHDEYRSRRKSLILLIYFTRANFVEFFATKSLARPFPWRWLTSGQPGA